MRLFVRGGGGGQKRVMHGSDMGCAVLICAGHACGALLRQVCGCCCCCRCCCCYWRTAGEAARGPGEGRSRYPACRRADARGEIGARTLYVQ